MPTVFRSKEAFSLLGQKSESIRLKNAAVKSILVGTISQLGACSEDMGLETSISLVMKTPLRT